MPLTCQPPSIASSDAVPVAAPLAALRPNGSSMLEPIEKRFGRSFGEMRSSSVLSAGFRYFSWSRVRDRVYCTVNELPLRKWRSSWKRARLVAIGAGVLLDAERSELRERPQQLLPLHRRAVDRAARQQPGERVRHVASSGTSRSPCRGSATSRGTGSECC